jgi:signal transduction histidine kinase/CheY-like chemotaxis protein
MANTSINVLLIEDNPDDAYLLRESLRDVGATEFKLTHVETLRDGLEQTAASDIDIVLLDLSLPDTVGLETLTRMLAKAPDIPVVVLTGLDDSILGTKAVQAGAQDYLVKRGFDGGLLARCLHYAIERHRLQQQTVEDAAVSAVLAHVGEELISAISTPVLADRLCRLTTEVLGCDFTHTWLWDAHEQAYAPVAHYGDRADIWESVRDLKVPPDTIRELLAGLEKSDVVQSAIGEPQHLIPAALGNGQQNVGGVVYMAIRRGPAVVGMLASGYRDRSEPFTSRHERIAKGLVHFASLGLENARLVEELEHSSLVKTYFAATMSHELRGAVGTMLLGTEDLLDELDASATPEKRESLEIMRQIGRESVDLIDATLEMHGLETRRNQAPPEIDIADFTRQIAHEISLAWKKNDTQLHWHAADGLPALSSDPVKLKMIVRNLAANAMKFTAHGTVSLEATAVDDGIQFTVSDTGIGIPQEELPTIFEPFHQAHGARSRRAGSAGLGLYIVRRLVDMLGGNIRVESEVGRGTTFRVWIPRACNVQRGVS